MLLCSRTKYNPEKVNLILLKVVFIQQFLHEILLNVKKTTVSKIISNIFWPCILNIKSKVLKKIKIENENILMGNDFSRYILRNLLINMLKYFIHQFDSNFFTMDKY